jgi:hypothetical protein
MNILMDPANTPEVTHDDENRLIQDLQPILFCSAPELATLLATGK